jgi:NADH-quinone oxidoreductase subunit J
MNTVILGIFFVLAAIIIGSALMVVTVRNLSHAASWLASSFAASAALYCLLQAPFVGIVQALITVVAITMLLGLTLRLTLHDPALTNRQLFRRWWLAALGALLLFALVLVPVLFQPGLPGGGSWPRNDPASLAPAETGAGTGASVAGAAEIGRSLMQEYVLPFEIAAILLLVGLIGAVVIARNEQPVSDEVTLSERGPRRRTARIYSIE